MEKTRLEEVKDVIDDLDKHERFLLKLLRDPKVGAVVFVHPPGAN